MKPTVGQRVQSRRFVAILSDALPHMLVQRVQRRSILSLDRLQYEKLCI